MGSSADAEKIAALRKAIEQTTPFETPQQQYCTDFTLRRFSQSRSLSLSLSVDDPAHVRPIHHLVKYAPTLVPGTWFIGTKELRGRETGPQISGCAQLEPGEQQEAAARDA